MIYRIPVFALAALLLTFGVPQLRAAPASRSKPASEARLRCPQTDLGETPLDCPWAGIARQMKDAAAAGKKIEPILKAQAPGLHAQLRGERKVKSWHSLWGSSINFDELAQGTIVEPGILKTLYSVSKIPVPDFKDAPAGLVHHAGLEHTYGYLFSLLRTQFGYKRARWVEGEIERGFGLPEHTLGPTAKEGSIYRNVTYFLGRIAFEGDTAQLSVLEAHKASVAPALRNFKYNELKRTRLLEKLALEGERTVALLTDLVAFTSADGTKNQRLLVYSYFDSKPEPRARLITAFPITDAFATGLHKSENLGEDKPIIARYNAYIPGVSGKTDLKGVRAYEE